MAALNPVQIEVLKFFDGNWSDDEIAEVKQILLQYKASKLTLAADKAFKNKGYKAEDIESWRKERMRIKSDEGSN